MNGPDKGPRFERQPWHRLGCGKTTFYQQIADGMAPRPVKWGRVSAWSSDEIDALMAERMAARGVAARAVCKGGR